MKYEIAGAPMPVLNIELEPNESIITESGAMSWMNSNIEMNTSSNGGIKKVFSRAFTGEHLFQNVFTARNGIGKIALASSFPGDIVPLVIEPGKEYIVEKQSFIAATPDVELSLFFQKKIGAGLFGGEGFIMQRLSGNGLAFIEVDGSTTRIQLQPGEKLQIDTGHLVMMESSCSINVEAVKGLKNMFLGGEGVFNTVVTGPGEVVLQSMPLYVTANALKPYIGVQSSSGNSSNGGTLATLGNIADKFT